MTDCPAADMLLELLSGELEPGRGWRDPTAPRRV